MKTKLFHIIISLILIISVTTSCGSSLYTSQEKQELRNQITQKVSDLNFTFKATYAYPTSYRAIYLSPYYDVKVSSDTVTAYLPYYGIAYSAPIDPTNGGIKFTSTTFDYEVKNGKKTGNWIIYIRLKEESNNYSLLFDIWDNGSARLSVSDSRRQSISFTGEIEVDKKENE